MQSLKTTNLIEKGREYDVFVAHVHDGDTYDCCLLVPIKIRLNGVQAAELNTDKGGQAADYVRKLIDKQVVSVQILGLDKYGGRYQGKVTLAGGKLLADLLIEKEMAVPWDGKGPRPFGESMDTLWGTIPEPWPEEEW